MIADVNDSENLQLRETIPESLRDNIREDITREDFVDTGTYGKIKIQVVGEGKKRAIFTYHDIGLNGLTY